MFFATIKKFLCNYKKHFLTAIKKFFSHNFVCFFGIYKKWTQIISSFINALDYTLLKTSIEKIHILSMKMLTIVMILMSIK